MKFNNHCIFVKVESIKNKISKLNFFIYADIQSSLSNSSYATEEALLKDAS
jgi:hypothetical protein